jgi:DNA (cytosine-5)-methyltransferase 1
MSLTFGSLFAGVGGFDEGLHRNGMKCEWQIEIDETCRSVLRRHFPSAKQGEDVRNVSTDEFVRPDVICGGFPCQDVSVAGKRVGLDGARSGLFYEFMRIVRDFSPRFVLIENVPGLLSSNGGRDMSTVVGTLAKLGYGWSYRIINAQYFGVPQRRRRVFIVGCFGDMRSAAEILFESESLPWDSPAGRKAIVAATLNSGGNSGGFRTEPGEHLVLIAFQSKQSSSAKSPSFDDVSPTLDVAKSGGMAVAYQCQGSNVGPMGTLRSGNGNESGGVPFMVNMQGGKGQGGYSVDVSPTLGADSQIHGVLPVTAWSERTRDEGSVIEIEPTGVFSTLKAGTQRQQGIGVRRLLPIECERLQGFPDDWTRYRDDGTEISDSKRYHMCGNAVAVPCSEWIGKRIVMVESR